MDTAGAGSGAGAGAGSGAGAGAGSGAGAEAKKPPRKRARKQAKPAAEHSEPAPQCGCGVQANRRKVKKPGIVCSLRRDSINMTLCCVQDQHTVVSSGRVANGVC